MIGKTKNKLLQTAERKIEAKVKPEFKTAFVRVVNAGLMLMYSEQTRSMVVQEMRKPGAPAQVVGEGIAKLMGLLLTKSKGTMPPQAMIPAATVLLCEGLGLAEDAGLVKVDNTVLASAMQEMTSALMQMLKITPDTLNKLSMNAPATAPAAAPPAPAPKGIVGQIQGAAA